MKSNYYLNFENRFRGERNKIINQLSIYDSLLDLSISNNTYSKFLDIGCGRGEWLEKWKDRVPDCFGVEIDKKPNNITIRDIFFIFFDIFKYFINKQI